MSRALARMNSAATLSSSSGTSSETPGVEKSKSIAAAAVSAKALDWEHSREWTEYDLHRLVAHYLAVRFPICLALNKVVGCLRMVL